MKRYQLLLKEDVYNLGKMGEVVTAKAGYARNFLIPRQSAVVATKGTLKMQARLQKEREEKSRQDREESEKIAMDFKGKVIKTKCRVDGEGRLFGSVSAVDIAALLKEEGIDAVKRDVILAAPIKRLGVHPVELRLKEGVVAAFSISVEAENEQLSSAAVANAEEQAEEVALSEEIEVSEEVIVEE